jgi:prepilin-type N-terminal cleavage/methylation domain-containing protein
MGRIRGFTLIELMVVLGIVATLLTIALPRYFASLENSREAALKQTLAVVREALDQQYGDTGAYPESLQALVEKRYLRKLPYDPITESTDTWVIVPPREGALGVVGDVKSGAPGRARDGTAFADW